MRAELYTGPLSDRIAYLISLMDMAKTAKYNFNMASWFENSDPVVNILEEHKNQESYHRCGTSACFAGWAVLDSEVREHANKIGEFETPAHIVAEFLSAGPSVVNPGVIEQVVLDIAGTGGGGCHRVYGKDALFVELDDVIEALETWKSYILTLETPDTTYPSWVHGA